MILTKGLKKIAFECKGTKTPTLSKGNFVALQDTGISELFVVAPVSEPFRMSHSVIAGSIPDAIEYALSEGH